MKTWLLSTILAFNCYALTCTKTSELKKLVDFSKELRNNKKEPIKDSKVELRLP
jgi:hypothetical protein